MNIWFNAIARAGGIEVAPEHRIFPPRQPKARRNRTTPGLARRVVADIAGGAPLRSIETGVSRLVEGFRAARRHRAAIGELSALSDHALKDIGLHRSEIPSVVHEMTRAAAPAQSQTPVSRRPARRLPLADTFLGAQSCAQPC
ncbi:MAG: DUF1127 domain-containing protein [Proteobacteria bacterium]|nr:DUF1127 domain-containing protein [Pseudomonadota bacterium]